jgi:hypothetical protein
MKPTDIWGYLNGWVEQDQLCKESWQIRAIYKPLPADQITGTQGITGAIPRSTIPYALGEEICVALETK